jgi:hypothetical protein
MTLPSIILRLLLALTVACWAPLCLCQRAQAAAGGEVASCCSKPARASCCKGGSEAPTKKPCDHEGSCTCGQRDPYTSAPSADYTPGIAAVVAVLTWPPAFALGETHQAHTAMHTLAERAPMPPTSLLRQHCALVV